MAAFDYVEREGQSKRGQNSVHYPSTVSSVECRAQRNSPSDQNRIVTRVYVKELIFRPIEVFSVPGYATFSRRNT